MRADSRRFLSIRLSGTLSCRLVTTELLATKTTKNTFVSDAQVFSPPPCVLFITEIFRILSTVYNVHVDRLIRLFLSLLLERRISLDPRWKLSGCNSSTFAILLRFFFTVARMKFPNNISRDDDLYLGRFKIS